MCLMLIFACIAMPDYGKYRGSSSIHPGGGGQDPDDDEAMRRSFNMRKWRQQDASKKDRWIQRPRNWTNRLEPKRARQEQNVQNSSWRDDWVQRPGRWDQQGSSNWNQQGSSNWNQQGSNRNSSHWTQLPPANFHTHWPDVEPSRPAAVIQPPRRVPVIWPEPPPMPQRPRPTLSQEWWVKYGADLAASEEQRQREAAEYQRQQWKDEEDWLEADPNAAGANDWGDDEDEQNSPEGSQQNPQGSGNNWSEPELEVKVEKNNSDSGSADDDLFLPDEKRKKKKKKQNEKPQSAATRTRMYCDVEWPEGTDRPEPIVIPGTPWSPCPEWGIGQDWFHNPELSKPLNPNAPFATGWVEPPDNALPLPCFGFNIDGSLSQTRQSDGGEHQHCECIWGHRSGGYGLKGRTHGCGRTAKTGKRSVIHKCGGTTWNQITREDSTAAHSENIWKRDLKHCYKTEGHQLSGYAIPTKYGAMRLLLFLRP